MEKFAPSQNNKVQVWSISAFIVFEKKKEKLDQHYNYLVLNRSIHRDLLDKNRI